MYIPEDTVDEIDDKMKIIFNEVSNILKKFQKCNDEMDRLKMKRQKLMNEEV